MPRATVSIAEQGREGRVIYTEGGHTLAGYQAFGGGDVVAIVSMGSLAQWQAQHPWAVERRAAILRFIADETVRQKAPTCTAEVDEVSGDIVLRSRAGAIGARVAAGAVGAAGGAAAHAPPAPAAAASPRRRFKAWWLAAGLLLAAAAWLKAVWVIEPGPGTPVSATVRTETHLATLIQRLQPYAPSLHHDPSHDRYTIGLFLVPLDGTAPVLVPVARDLQPGRGLLARVIGSDGRTLWLSVDGLYGVDLRTHALHTARDVRRAAAPLDPRWTDDPRGMDVVDGRLRLLAPDHRTAYALDPLTWAASPVAPRPVARALSTPPPAHHMAAGFCLSPSRWLGLHSSDDLADDYRPRRRVREVEGARDAPEARHLVLGELAPEADALTGSRRIVSMQPVQGSGPYLNASFLRPDEASPPLRLAAPDSVLMLHTLDPAQAGGTLAVSRVDLAGHVLWTRDTAIQRFRLQQILPGERHTVFVGTRVPVPDRVSEPLLVILDHASGQLTTRSLWQ